MLFSKDVYWKKGHVIFLRKLEFIAELLNLIDVVPHID